MFTTSTTANYPGAIYSPHYKPCFNCINCKCEVQGPSQYTGTKVCSLCWMEKTALERMLLGWQLDAYAAQRKVLHETSYGHEVEKDESKIDRVRGVAKPELATVFVQEQYGEEFER